MKAKLPIASKFIGGFVLILLGISTFLFLFFPQNIKETLLEKELINAEVLIDVVSVGASIGLAEGDFEVLGLTIKIAKEFPNAQYILFMDATNEQVAEYNPNDITTDTSYTNIADGTLILKDKLIIKAPLIFKDQVYGSLILNYSLENTNKNIANYREKIILLSILILIIGAFFSVALSKLATNNIRQLMAASNQVIKGNLEADVNISSNDEFGLLGNNFNYMLQSLRENKHVEAINTELRDQKSQLEAKNVELEEKSEKLKEQQSELESSNEELTQQKERVAQKNELLQKTSTSLFEKAKQLELSNNYKSEFLANMSHELRSPLNSMLILANDLTENETNNLTEDQVESANIIYAGGKELLTLINDILDLSKIESGKMEVVTDQINLHELALEAKNKYKHMAESKNLDFVVLVDENVPNRIQTDGQRVKQIVNNLLSNAIKFTEKGKVTLQFTKKDIDHFNIIVTDSGIGIPKDKQQLVFNAFTQADGGTTRKYGGTGLGLTITSQLCSLLSGTIRVKSEENKGAEFCVTLPISINDTVTKQNTSSKIVTELPAALISLKNDHILIIEDDQKFAAILSKEIVKLGYQVSTTIFGVEGLELAKLHLPGAIILDMNLPDISGVAVLDALKSDETLKRIPVHVISASKHEDFKEMDIVQFITKPVDIKSLKLALKKIGNPKKEGIKKVLLVEDHNTTRQTLKKLFNSEQLEIVDAGSIAEAQKIVEGNVKLDGVILDLTLPDGSGKELLTILYNQYGIDIPQIIVYTGKDMGEEEVVEINHWAKSIIIKGERSEKRLLEEISLFLNHTHKVDTQKEMIISNNKYDMFLEKTILLVDDDMRNVFALSKMLVNKGMKVIKAANGFKALNELEKENNIEMVLMDIMMPEMDGYEAMQRIRKMEQYKKLPIIALTAKAMKDDKEKCINAGANDYMSKPIDIEKLFNLMRVWIT